LEYMYVQLTADYINTAVFCRSVYDRTAMIPETCSMCVQIAYVLRTP